MNIFAQFEARVREALESLVRSGSLPGGLDFSRVVVEPPRDPSHGDLATNAALVLAKDAKTNPKALGEALAVELRKDPRVVEASVAGPGFINLRRPRDHCAESGGRTAVCFLAGTGDCPGPRRRLVRRARPARRICRPRAASGRPGPD